MVLETNRLVLRKLTDCDLPSLKLILQDEAVMYAYNGAFNDDEVTRWLDKQLLNYEHYGFGLWAVIEQNSGLFIGQCGLTMQPCKGQEVLEIGYLFRKEFWHHGFATEAATACKVYAFTKLDANVVYAIIRDTNLPSQNVAKRIGMLCVDTFVKHYRGIDMPHLVFSAARDAS